MSMDMVQVRFNSAGGVQNFDARPRGTMGALGSYVGNPEGMLKSGATLLDVVQLVVSDDRLGAVSQGFKAAGGACSISKALVAWTGVAGGVIEGKYDRKFAANVAKGVGETASFIADIEKMGGVTLSADALQATKATKGLFTLVADTFALHHEMVTRPTDIAARASSMTPLVLAAETTSSFYGTVRAIMAFTFHLFLAIGAIFLIPLAPLAVTLLASLYIVAITVAHFVESNTRDIVAVDMAARLNCDYARNNAERER